MHRRFRLSGFLAFCLTLCWLAMGAVTFGQDGVSTAGAARARYLGNMGVLPTAKEVVVEDFVNYHRHEIARPKAGEAVGLDIRWGNESVAPNGEAVLQVGLSTTLVHDRQNLRPLNLSIVIDKSGSMADDDKLVRVKQALVTMVNQLRPTDELSIVVFDSNAEVLLPSQDLSDRERVKDLIRSIEPGSATNLHDGLMLGYSEALKHFRKEATNRVILLTDGIANRGVTDPNAIARASASYNDRGIDLTTIGVGLDLNKELLQALAKSGHGLFHFIADSKDIEKVFVKELQSQISPVATDAKLTVDYGRGLKLDRVFGYAPRLNSTSATIGLDNMNSGMTEVVLLRFRSKGESEDAPRAAVKVTLTYFDLDRNKTVETSQEAPITVVPGLRKPALEDASVAKNYAIASLAQAIHDMASDAENHRYQAARRAIDAAIAKTARLYPNMDDEDIKRTMSIAEKYQIVLRQQVGETDTTDADRDEPSVIESGANLISNGDFSLGNSGFSSALDYIRPADNCLWGSYYTVAPDFNSVRLHRLVHENVLPPVRNSRSQVLYANAGADGPLVLWSSVVKCKPNTWYRISFKVNSLSEGQNYIPEFEIKVGDNHGTAQAAGYQTYSTISMMWNSQNLTNATVNIIRLTGRHTAGIVGIGDIKMVQSGPSLRD